MPKKVQHFSYKVFLRYYYIPIVSTAFSKYADILTEKGFKILKILHLCQLCAHLRQLLSSLTAIPEAKNAAPPGP